MTRYFLGQTHIYKLHHIDIRYLLGIPIASNKADWEKGGTVMRVGSTFGRAALMGGAALAQILFLDQAVAQTAEAQIGPAQQQAAGEIVVTAQRREQSIAKVGIAITAISGDALNDLGVQSTQGIAAHVPALQFDGGSGGGLNAFVTIRGVSQVDVSEHQESPNAVYLDEVYVPTPSMVGFPIYDLERAEALRGPQGTLFGRNSTGGLLHFITADPTDEPSGYFDLSYANYNTVRAEAAASGSLAKGVNFRISGFANYGDGYFQNLAPGGRDTFQSRTYGVRGKLSADIGDWNVKLTASYNDSPNHREGTYKSTPAYIDANGIAQFVPEDVDYYGTGAGNDPYGFRDRERDAHKGAFNSIGFLEKNYYYGTMKISGPIGGATLTSITNYSHARINYKEDAEGTPNDVYVFGSRGKTRQISQELRLNGSAGPVEWTLGGYYLDLDGTYANDSDLRPLTSLLGQGPFHSINDFTQRTKSYAAFGQIEYSLAQALKVTLGGRYTHDKKIFSSQTYDITSGTPTLLADFSPDTVGELAKISRGDWAGKVQLDYTGIDDMLLYAGISRGIRGGGFNTNLFGNISSDIIQFKNESVLSYEAGAKLRMFDGAAHLFLSGFYYDYKDFQAFNFVGTSVLVSNLPAYMYGGEAELSVTPIHNLNIALGGSYLKGKVKGLIFNGEPIDVAPVKSPKWTFNGIVSKKFELGFGDITPMYDFNYISDSRSNLVPSPTTDLRGGWIHNARISFTPRGTQFEIYGFIRNFTDEDRKNFAYDNAFIGLNDASYAPPRTYGVGFHAKF